MTNDEIQTAKMSTPLLSVVIANYNYGQFIGATLRSLFDQDRIRVCEVIVVDALSTDNSVEVIKEFAGNEKRIECVDGTKWHVCERLTWTSERDGGQSDAFNKGFAYAHGKWLTWLNADDLLMPLTISAFEHHVAKTRNSSWICGNKLTFDSDSGTILEVNWGPHCSVPFLTKNKTFNAVYGPTTFWTKELYTKAGPFEVGLNFAMDTEYWARLTMLGVRQDRLNHICWAFREHNKSKTSGIQDEKTTQRRIEETKYWRRKTGYHYEKSVKNLYYILWCVWRIIDGSWFVRMLMKLRYEGKQLTLSNNGI